MPKQQHTGMRGVPRGTEPEGRGWTVSSTHATRREQNCWRTHIYVFVNGAKGSDQRYYVVPSAVVKRRTTEDRGGWFAFSKVGADKYKDAWSTIRR